MLSFCKAELLVDNYFHAVFEATKSIAEKIRIKTNLTSDGSELVDHAFSYKGKIPYLALNNLTTESHESEQKGARKFFTLGAGFKYNIVKVDVSYLFSASKVRNPLENTLRFSLTFNFGDDYDEL